MSTRRHRGRRPVATRGFTIMMVGYGRCQVPGCCPGRDPNPFAYTIGLTDRDHPELLVRFDDADDAAHALDYVATQIVEGRELSDGDLIVLPGPPYLVRATAVRDCQDVLLVAVLRYGADEVTALELSTRAVFTSGAAA